MHHTGTSFEIIVKTTTAGNITIEATQKETLHQL